MHHHNTFKEYCGSLGSPMFSSINSHLGFEPGRQDDIEALIYVLLYFTCRSLPWLGHTPCLKHNAIASMKQDILQHNDIPKALFTMLSYTQSLSFTQKPDYDYLRTLVKGLCINLLNLATRLKWLCSDNITFMYESCSLVGETNKLVGKSVTGKQQRYLHIWHLVFNIFYHIFYLFILSYQCVYLI